MLHGDTETSSISRKYSLRNQIYAIQTVLMQNSEHCIVFGDDYIAVTEKSVMINIYTSL